MNTKNSTEENEDSAIGSKEHSSPTPSYASAHSNEEAIINFRKGANGSRPQLDATTIQMNDQKHNKLSAPGHVDSFDVPIVDPPSPSKYDNIPLEPIGQQRNELSSFYFEDGCKRIDFILVYDTSNGNNEKNKVYTQYREYFEKNLRDDGLLLESANDDHSTLRYIKIHAPFDVLCRYAEIMKLKMPMKHVESGWKVILDDDDPYCRRRFTIPYTRDKEYLFNIPPVKERFFTTAQRSQIVDFILRRKSFSPKTDDASAFGLNKLLQDSIYTAAYPLHEGKLTGGKRNRSPRMNLATNWASLIKMFRKQPLDEIRNYFGVKIALYFAWLGFYTSMLIPASIVGVLCFFYGVITLQYDIPSQQICNNTFDHIEMCPLCTMRTCKFWKLSESCSYARMTYLFDNPATVFFAVFMSLWATVYLEMWKRYSARITYRWDLSTFDMFEEYPRP
ncbi:anoctamin-1-like protein, partial [Leptotrombidium deliense]